MKKILSICFWCCMATFSFAQLDADIEIIKDSRIDKYMNMFSYAAKGPVVKQIHRIQLVSTYNRGEADRTQGGFRSRFPDVQTFKTHDGVKFVVRAGRFESRGEAEAKLQDIRRYFPSAFILPPERVIE